MPSPAIFTHLLSALSFTTRQADSWPDPEPCTGNCTFIHDPAVIRRDDGTWFRFSTIGNIAVATAPALTGPWTYQGAMLPEGTIIDVRDDQELWAPDVFKSGDTYYSYYSVSRSGLQISDIGVATSKTCEPGSWTDHGSVGVPKFLGEDGYNLIDANFFRECDTCINHWNFGSGWQGVFQTSLNDDLLTWSGETPMQKIYNSTIPPNQNFEAIAEGGYLFWWPVDDKKYYYMFFSSGACCNAADKLAAPGDEYKIMVCRAESPTGPFFDQSGRNCASENGGTLILGSHGKNVYAPGGQGVLVDPDVDRIVLYYHYADPTIGYGFDKFLFGFNYLDFSSGWPVVTT